MIAPKDVEPLPAPAGPAVRRWLLMRARQVNDRTLARLRQLGPQLPEALASLLARAANGDSPERRRFARCPDSSLSVVVQLPSKIKTASRLLDHTARGFALLLPCPSSQGTILRVALPAANGEVRAEVKHCRRRGRHWLTGCELLPGQPSLLA